MPSQVQYSQFTWSRALQITLEPGKKAGTGTTSQAKALRSRGQQQMSLTSGQASLSLTNVFVVGKKKGSQP